MNKSKRKKSWLFLLWRYISAGDALQAILIWLKSLSLITWDINPCIASMVVLQLKNKHKFNVGQTLNWTVILFEDIQLFWKFRVPITPWILTTVQKGKVTHSNLAIVANSFLLLKKQTDEHYTHIDQFQKALSGNLGHLTLTIASELCGRLNWKNKKIPGGMELPAVINTWRLSLFSTLSPLPNPRPIMHSNHSSSKKLYREH